MSMQSLVVEPLLQASARIHAATGVKVPITVEVPAEIFDRIEPDVTTPWMREGRIGEPARTMTVGPGVVLQRDTLRSPTKKLEPQQLHEPSALRSPTDDEVRDAFMVVAGAIGGPRLDEALMVLEAGMHDLDRLPLLWTNDPEWVPFEKRSTSTVEAAR